VALNDEQKLAALNIQKVLGIPHLKCSLCGHGEHYWCPEPTTVVTSHDAIVAYCGRCGHMLPFKVDKGKAAC